MLPTTLTIQTAAKKADPEVPVEELGCTDVPAHDGNGYDLDDRSDWDGHCKSGAASHLTRWKFPERVQEVRHRAERALEDGVPDQRRSMLRNQDWGMIDDRYMVDMALAEEVERPFMRWSRIASGEVRVAICLDATVCCGDTAEKIEARMCVAAGLASALEGLDYDVSVVAACLLSTVEGSCNPRQSTAGRRVFATVLKDEREAMTDSGFAHLADSGFRRLMYCWVMKDNGFATHLTDQEWRKLTDADLFIYIGAEDKPEDGRIPGWGEVINEHGKPDDARIGPEGEDALRLNVQGMKDVDKAVTRVEAFFGEHCE